MQNSLAEMGHPKPPTPAAADILAAASIVNGKDKRKQSRVIGVIFNWV